MQPYLFPYLGYYQLVNSVDKFVFYDDVTYIKSGYINRNSILHNGRSQRFTIPVVGASSNKNIRSLNFDSNVKKTLKSISFNYQSSPYFSEVYPMIEDLLLQEDRNIANLCAKSIKLVFDYVGKDKDFVFSSDLNYLRTAEPSDKLIEICKRLSCKTYINSIGGHSLYSRDYFNDNGVELFFIKTKKHTYKQGTQEFVPNLSMIDLMMWNSKENLRFLLDQFELSTD